MKFVWAENAESVVFYYYYHCTCVAAGRKCVETMVEKPIEYSRVESEDGRKANTDDLRGYERQVYDLLLPTITHRRANPVLANLSSERMAKAPSSIGHFSFAPL